MSVTASGALMLGLALYVFLRRPHRLFCYLVFFAPFSATAVVNLTALGYKSGGVGVTPAIVFALLVFAANLLFDRGSPIRVSPGHLVMLAAIGVFWIELAGSQLFNIALHGATSFQVTQTVYISLGIAVTVVLSLELVRGENLELAIRAARASAMFVSVWGLLQYFCFTFGVPYPSGLFNNSLSDAADMFDQNSDGFMRIASVAVEPSFFAASMLHFGVFGATLLAVEPRFRTAGWLLPVGVTLATLVISTATTAYVGLAVFAVLMLARRPLISILVGTPIALAAAISIALIPKLRDAILIMTIHKSTTGSYVDRLQRMQDSLDQFYQAPIFGLGWSKTFNFNVLTTLLANTGLVGTTIALAAGAALLLELGTVKPAPGAADGWRLAAYAAGAQNMLIVAFACAVSSGLKYVVLDDACFGAIALAILSRIRVAQPVRPAAMRACSIPGARAVPRQKEPAL